MSDLNFKTLDTTKDAPDSCFKHFPGALINDAQKELERLAPSFLLVLVFAAHVDEARAVELQKIKPIDHTPEELALMGFTGILLLLHNEAKLGQGDDVTRVMETRVGLLDDMVSHRRAVHRALAAAVNRAAAAAALARILALRFLQGTTGDTQASITQFDVAIRASVLIHYRFGKAGIPGEPTTRKGSVRYILALHHEDRVSTWGDPAGLPLVVTFTLIHPGTGIVIANDNLSMDSPRWIHGNPNDGMRHFIDACMASLFIFGEDFTLIATTPGEELSAQMADVVRANISRPTKPDQH